MRNHFMKITFRFVCYHWDSRRGDFYLSKGNVIIIIVKHSHCLCSTLTPSDQKNIDQVTQKTVIHSIYSGSVQGFWKLPPRRFAWVTFEQHRGNLKIMKSKNHLHSYAVGVQMIFWHFKILNHSRQNENSNFLDSHGLLRVTFTSKSINIVRIRLRQYSVTCFYTHRVWGHHAWPWWDSICT